MVATVGRGWVLAPCLVRLIDETDRLFPNRSTVSDGSVGDTAHSARVSDHNPDGGYVRAVDITDDDAHGCDVSILAHHLVATKDPRVKYLIHKGTIWKARTGFRPEVYTGSNAHTRHLHVSILDGQERALGLWWPQSKPTPPKPAPIPTVEDETMFIMKAKDKATRFVDAPIAINVSGPTVDALKRAGVKELTFSAGEYDAVIKQVGLALD